MANDVLKLQFFAIFTITQIASVSNDHISQTVVIAVTSCAFHGMVQTLW